MDLVVVDREKVILRGVVRHEDGRPFANETLFLLRASRVSSDGGQTWFTRPGEELDRTITSSDGRYAFYVAWESMYFLSADGVVVRMEDGYAQDRLPGFFNTYPFESGITSWDAVVTP